MARRVFPAGHAWRRVFSAGHAWPAGTRAECKWQSQMAVKPNHAQMRAHLHEHRYATKMDKTRRELKANLQRLHALALKTNLPGATQKLALINQRLAVYSETSEVAKILMEMLDDIEQRLKIIDTVDEQAKKLVEDTEAKMV